jgi:hypothetical protein
LTIKRKSTPKLPGMLCPNCMSPYVEPVSFEAEDAGEAAPDEPLMHCTECEYAAPRSEFLPENYR